MTKFITKFLQGFGSVILSTPRIVDLPTARRDGFRQDAKALRADARKNCKALSLKVESWDKKNA